MGKAYGIAAFLQGALEGHERRRAWELAAEERARRKEDQKWQDETRVRQRTQWTQADIDRQTALSDAEIAREREAEEYARTQTLQQREDEEFARKEGLRKAAKEGVEKARESRNRDIEKARVKRARSMLPDLPMKPPGATESLVLPGSVLDQQSPMPSPARPAIGATRPQIPGAAPPSVVPGVPGQLGAPVQDPSRVPAEPMMPATPTLPTEPIAPNLSRGIVDPLRRREVSGQGWTAQQAQEPGPMLMPSGGTPTPVVQRGATPPTARGAPGRPQRPISDAAPLDASELSKMPQAAAVQALPVGPIRDTPGAPPMGIQPRPSDDPETVVGEFMDYYLKEAVPDIAAAYLEQGLVEDAKNFQTWANDERTKKGRESWGRMMHARAVGDEDAFINSLVDTYNAQGYYDDGFEIVREKSTLTKNADGQTIGADVTFRNQETGQESMQHYTTEDLMAEGSFAFGPDQVYEHGKAVLEAERTAAAAEDVRVKKVASDIAKKMVENATLLGQPVDPAAIQAAVQAALAAETQAIQATRAPSRQPPAARVE